jgi:hypothetical protein
MASNYSRARASTMAQSVYASLALGKRISGKQIIFHNRIYRKIFESANGESMMKSHDR